MPYCERCGAELEEGAKYCPSCGTPVGVPQIRIERRGRMPGAARILLLIFGSIILLVGIALLAAGGALLAVNTGLTDSEGFIATNNYRLERESYAIVSQPINIDIGEIAGEWGVWRPSPGDFVTIRLTALSNDPSKNVFIGIAPEEDVQSYLLDVYYHEVTRFSVSASRDLTVEYTTHPGESVTSDPASQTFWTVSQHGTGRQTLDWAPEAGNYWIVLMNEDGSAGVDSTITLGAKIPLLLTIGLALFGGGAIALVIGALMIYFGARR